jgi:hypothetical protein
MTLQRRAERKLPRLRKYARRWLHVLSSAGRPQTRVAFVFGSQRSGTRLPLQILDHVPEIMSYSEGTAPWFRGVLLAPVPELDRLVARNPFPVAVLKPICETHRFAELLDHFPQSRALWMFRSYTDAVNSASAKWNSGKEAVRRLAHGELDRAGWRAGGLSAKRLELVRRLYRDDLSLHAANAIMWYLRNSLYFDLAADRRRDVMLVRYEELVTRPEALVPRIGDFLGVHVPASYRRDVFSSSVSKKPFPPIPAEIAERCEELERRLIAHYEHSLRSAPSPAGLSPALTFGPATGMEQS